MAVNPSAFGPKPQFVDVAGNPAISYKLFFYVAGSTSTKQDTFTDSTGLVANTNPIILNALGEPSTQIWWPAGQSFKVVLAPPTDTDPPSSPVWTIDNLYGINDFTNSPAQSEWVLSPLIPTFINATTFTLPGNQTADFQIDRRVKTVNTAGLAYGNITNSVFTTLTTVTLLNTSGVLDSGLSQVSYGLLSATNPSVPATYAKSRANADITSLDALTKVASIPVRQTVLFGPVDTNGLPAFGGSTGATTVTTTAISTTAPLVVTAANGFNAQGAINFPGQSTTNLAFTGLSTNGTMYLYVDVANGTLTPGTGTLAPNYQTGGTYSTTANQFTFNQSEMVGKVGNGATAVQTNRVYVGQVTVAGNVVTAIVWYALQGQYIGPYNTPLPGAATAMSQNHNIGVVPENYDLVLENVTGEFGYQVGAKIKTASIFTSDATTRLPMAVTVTRTSAAAITGASSGMAAANQATGTGTNLTAANWKWKFIASRGW